MFYQQLPSFSEFENFTHEDHYQPLPKDWVVVVTDIMNSTRAIEDGLYKEVNLIGAASITQTMQALKTQDIPFVFGGDGASLCIPVREKEAVSQQLAALQVLAENNFGLKLRVGMIPVADIRAQGAEVLVAKLEITRGKYIAMFRGGGLAAADRLAKADEQRYAITEYSGALDSLSGLSCRWSPIPSRQGKVLSLLVMARETDSMEAYNELLLGFRQVMGREITQANPVENSLVWKKSVADAVREEARYHRSRFSFSFLLRLVDILLAVSIYKHGFNPVSLFFNAGSYKDSIGSHSDYRKFDDTLRLIVDCNEEEFALLCELLEEGYRNGKLYYGLHTSGQALMTCFVESVKQGGHLHFIDGGDGGLAIAAQQLKKQMQAS